MPHGKVIVYKDINKNVVLAEVSLKEVELSSGLERGMISDEMFIVAAKIKTGYYYITERDRYHFEIIR